MSQVHSVTHAPVHSECRPTPHNPSARTLSNSGQRSESNLQPRRAYRYRYALKRSHNPLCPHQLRSRVRPYNTKHTGTSSQTGTYTRRRIFHHQTILRPQSQQLGATPIRLWIRPAPLDHIRTDNPLRDRQPRRLQTSQQQSPGRRRHNRSSFHRQTLEQRLHPRQHHKIGHIVHLQILDVPEPLLRIDIRTQRPDNLDSAHPVRHLVDLRVGNLVVLSPLPPATHHRSNRADQHPIHIEQNALRSHANRLAQTSRPCRTNSFAATSTLFTDSTEQLSQYTRSSGSVPDARSSSHVSAALGLPTQSGFSKKNLIPSSVSTRSTFSPAKSAVPTASFKAFALAIADCFNSSSICISMRPYWCSPNSSCNAATSWPSVFFSSAITLASSSEFSNPSRSGRCRLMPMPPDSWPPIGISCSSIRSQTYLKPIPCSCRRRPYFAQIRSSIFVVLKARVTSPGHFLRSKSHFNNTTKILCASTTLPCSSTAPIRSASPSVIRPASHLVATTAPCVTLMCGRIGSGLIPGNAGLISSRISTYGTPALEKIPATTPRPAPYMQSIKNLYPEARIASRSTNRAIAAM